MRRGLRRFVEGQLKFIRDAAFYFVFVNTQAVVFVEPSTEIDLTAVFRAKRKVFVGWSHVDVLFANRALSLSR